MCVYIQTEEENKVTVRTKRSKGRREKKDYRVLENAITAALQHLDCDINTNSFNTINVNFLIFKI